MSMPAPTVCESPENGFGADRPLSAPYRQRTVQTAYYVAYSYGPKRGGAGGLWGGPSFVRQPIPVGKDARSTCCCGRDRKDSLIVAVIKDRDAQVGHYPALGCALTTELVTPEGPGLSMSMRAC